MMIRPHLTSTGLALAIGLVVPGVILGNSPIVRSQPALGQSIQDRKGEADQGLTQGIQYLEQSQYAVALTSLQRAVDLYRQLQDRKGEGYALYYLGQLHERTQDYRTAIQFYRQAFDLATQVGNPQQAAQILLDIAYGSWQLADSPADYQAAIAIAQQGLDLAKRASFPSGEARALALLGVGYTALEEFPLAIDYLQQSLAIARSGNETPREIGLLRQLGYIYGYKLSNYPDAIRYFQQAITAANRSQDLSSEALTWAGLSDLYWLMGDYSNSIEAAEKTRQIGQRLKNPELEAYGLLALVAAYYGQGSPKVEETLYQSLTLVEQTKIPWLEATATAYLGWWYTDAGDYQTAYEFAQRSLMISRQNPGQGFEEIALYVLGTIHRKQGQPDQAIAAYREIADKRSIYFYRASVGLAQVYQDLGQPMLAIAYYKQAINEFERIRSTIRLASPDAQQSFLKAVQGIERQKTSEAYRQLASLLISHDRILEAQQVLDLLKVQELSDYLHNVRGNAQTAQGVEVLKPEAEILQRYSILQEQAVTLGDRDDIEASGHGYSAIEYSAMEYEALS